MRRRRFLAPEVIQTSSMDCGPAALKSILEGFGVHLSYGRLREACQTSVDGTSIDVIEEVAQQLGADAVQTLLPVDDLLRAEWDALPAILVVKTPDGAPHFVVAWRRVGDFVQIMDPASGRRWLRAKELEDLAFVHELAVPASDWRAWASEPTFERTLRARMRQLAASDALVVAARADPSPCAFAALDAAVRLTETLASVGAIDRGPESARVVAALFEDATRELDARRETDTIIPKTFWSVRPTSPAPDGEARVLLRGAVLMLVRGASKPPRSRVDAEPYAPELVAALREPPARPLRMVLQQLREDGLVTPALVTLATFVAVCGAALEAVVLRGFFGVAARLSTWEQRLLAVVAVAGLFALLLGIEVPLASQLRCMGRRLELRLRMAFLAKLPRLGERYFSSRPASDMAHRAHLLQAVRQLPQLGFQLVRDAANILVTSIGLVWLAPRSWPLIVIAAATCLAMPVITHRAIRERDARVRAFDGTLAHFYLDALLGLVPLRTHGAEGAIRREHDSMLAEMRRAFLGLMSVSTSASAITAGVSAVMTIALLAHYLASGGEPTRSLLLVYWALALPALGAQLSATMRQSPQLRNIAERALEPLGALSDEEAEDVGGDDAETTRSADGVDVRFDDVSVRTAGKTILQGVHTTISAGEHVAIVGASGAGKSSLCGLLLGFHRAEAGRVIVDGLPLGGEALVRLREQTAWVDPAVQLWNRTLFANIEYGSSGASQDFGAVIADSDVAPLLEKLPDGLQTQLGEGGALVSGGEGQRVRLARAMLRPSSRLVVLDEPFRGLDREKRRDLLARARRLWSRATLLCVTHDVGETLDFDRVLVIDGGRIVEDGAPRELAADVGSRYRTMLDTERAVRQDVWRGKLWRRLELRAGVLAERYDQGPP